MLIKNCKIIKLDHIELGSVLIEDGKIQELNPANYECNEVIDANGLFLSPGFIVYIFMVLEAMIQWTELLMPLILYQKQ